MAKLDVYHRGFLSYRDETKNNKACVTERRIIKKLNDEYDVFKVKKFLCTIDDEWIKKIEKGLEFVEKAVEENRQFIQVNGEVVPIEKAKKVSKHSVEHLAKHSNLITKIPENPTDTIIPDGIYMVEKLNDFAIYENRFLYTLLCYLRDFIALRLEKIYELRSTYICDFSFKKTLESKKHNYTYNVSFHDEIFDNPYPIPDDTLISQIKRISDCQEIVMMLLNTDMMNEVSKSPKVKAPIVKTNVLKMNNNFKNALLLYDYIVGYEGDGYQAEEVVNDLVPLSETVGDEVSELILLTSYLSYKHGNDITNILDLEYQKEEERRRIEEEEKMRAHIKRLKKRIEESGMGIEEYVLAIEKQNRLLERDAEDLMVARNEILKLNEEIEQLHFDKEELNRRIVALEDIIEEKNKEIAWLNQKHIEEMNALRKEHEQEIISLRKEHEDEIELLHQEYADKIENINHEHREKIIELEEEFALKFQAEVDKYLGKMSKLSNEIKDLTEKFNNATIEHKQKVKELNSAIADKQSEMNEKVKVYESNIKDLHKKYKGDIAGANKEKDRYERERNLLAAELTGIRVMSGKQTPTLEFTAKERFLELEEEFNAFNKFFKTQWKLTKKEIRKAILWNKQENKQEIISKSNDKFTEVEENTEVEADEIATMDEVQSVEVETVDETNEVSDTE